MVMFDRTNPAFAGFNEPVRAQVQLRALEVEGTIPHAIQGTFYRVVPDPQFTPSALHLLIDGDGMVTALRFRDGQVDFTSRYVETDRFRCEREARRSLFGMYRNPYSDDPSAAGVDRTLANTAMLVIGGRLHAAKEDGLPHEIDPRSLETGRKFDAGGRIVSRTLSAHPKADPDTGEVITYGAAARGECTPDIAYYVLDRAGQVRHEAWFTQPFGAILHDFAITPRWSIFPIFPVTNSLARIQARAPIYQWEPERGTHVAVMPRHGTARDVRWFRTDACFAFHVVNSFEDGERVHIDVVEAECFPFPFPSSTGEDFDPLRAVPRLTRWTLDLGGASDQIARTRLYHGFTEMPVVDPHRVGKPYRHAFMGVDDFLSPIAHAPSESIFCFNALGHWDHETRAMRLWHCGPTSAVQEPVFVPRGPGAAEADGFLLAAVNRYAENRSDVVVLDTRDIAAGPVATVRLPLRLKNGVHGTWLPAASGG